LHFAFQTLLVLMKRADCLLPTFSLLSPQNHHIFTSSFQTGRMTALKQSLRRIPYWAFLIVIIVISVKTLSIINNYRIPLTGSTEKIENGHCIIEYVIPGGPLDQAGIKIGDTVLSCNSLRVSEWISGYHDQWAGDTLIIGISRNNQETRIPVILTSRGLLAPGFYWSIYLIMIVSSMAGLYILLKKPQDKTVHIFFIYIQFVIIMSNGGFTRIPDPFTIIEGIIFKLSSCLIGPLLIHFHMLFPKPLKVISRYKLIPVIFYFLGFLIFIFYSAEHFYSPDPDSTIKLIFNLMDKISLHWTTWTFVLAMAVVIYQYRQVKDTLSRNQVLIIIAGSCFGFITPVVMTLFLNDIYLLWDKYPNMIPITQGTGSFIMIVCILIAIFRYRIWDIEVFIRKALLYIGATAVIILSYLFLIWFVDRFISQETNLTRFVILAVSVILFLVLRDRLQHMIDRLFHRETYDSATVVSDFEAKLAGIYRFDELKEQIFRGLDDIFHFSFFTFHLKKRNLIYEPVFIYSATQPATGNEDEINRELEERLQKGKVFSPEELNKKPPILEETNGELVVPLVSDGQPNGFFICGQKKSERIYSRQDIQVLRLLAQRVVSLLHTAGLYQKDLDRQLMLERERARISQDMHDDVGASLTRISILSELAKNRAETDRETKQWLEQITSTSRGVMEEMSQIIWALNPKNDTLEGLIAYIRRFANEYLESTSVHCSFELPEILPNLPLTVEVRRNIYLVIREALHNVVKHSGATQVSISLIMNEHSFNIIIKDDGKGFDPYKLEFPGNGLVNMKKRMADIGGEFLIISNPGKGTEITLLVSPLPVRQAGLRD
jgi:signal transduction histidine kinase